MTPQIPLLDIVVPYFGAKSLLEETVHSVLRQTRADWRLTVVEDGDQGWAAGQWIEALADPRVRHVRNSSTLGVARNFQRCLELAEADLVAFPGCDDILEPDYVETVTAAAHAHPEVAAVLPGVRVVDEHGRNVTPAADRVKALLRPQSPSVIEGEAAISRLCDGNWTYFPATCWRRRDISHHGFRQDMGVALDLDLLLNLLLEERQLLVLPDPVFRYRRHRNSASSVDRGDLGRFVEERRLLSEVAVRAAAIGWTRAALHARVRATSRLHALAALPAALGRPQALLHLGRHVLGP